MRFLSFFLLCCSASSFAPAQDRSAADSLLLLQDARTTNVHRIRIYLKSANPAVAARAAQAAANLQDTTLLEDILPLLHSPSALVRENAALAFGQTAVLLSPAHGRSLLPVIMETLDHGPRNDRLVDECGKFGDKALLDSLMQRYFHVGQIPSHAQLLGIARFAIRGIATPLSERSLLRLCATPQIVQWETVYALQRAGDHDEVRTRFNSIRSLIQNKDPLVRMNVAALAGKLHDFPPALELIRMLMRDRDWRVRTNAARSLTQWPVTKTDLILADILRPLRDPSPHVAIALLTALATDKAIPSRLAAGENPEFVHAIDTIAMDIRKNDIPLVIASFDLFARLHGDYAVPVLLARARPESPTAAPALSALGRTASPRALRELVQRWLKMFPNRRPQKSGSMLRPAEACAILEGLRHWAGAQRGLSIGSRDSLSGVCLRGLKTNDIAIIATAAEILSDSLLRNRSFIPNLKKALRAVRLPIGIEAAQQIVQTLHVLGDTSASVPSHVVERTFSLDDISALPDTVRVRFTTAKGSIDAQLYSAAAPFTVASFVSLARKGFFNSRKGKPMLFHRVVPNFVVQGGDPRGDGWGGPDYAIRTEISTLEFETGSIGMASAGKDTEGSQFFFTHSPQPHLDGKYTVFGRIFSGLRIVDLLQAGDSLLSVTVTNHE